MRVKLDENIDPSLAQWLAARGHDAATVRGQGLSGTEDTGIYWVCRQERRTLVTLDLDFSNPLRFPPEPTAGIVVLRPHRATLSQIARLLARAEPVLARESLDGRLAIVEPNRIRLRDPGRRDGG